MKRKLQTLKPRLQPLPPRLAYAPPPSRAPGYRKTGRAGVADRDRIRRRDDGLCQACLERNLVTLGTQVDHVIPLHKGGLDVDQNKRLLCDECHLAKSANELKAGA